MKPQNKFQGLEEMYLDTDGPAGMEAAGGDADLCAEAEAEAVAEARRGVRVYARAVHAPQELLRQRRVLCGDVTGVTMEKRHAWTDIIQPRRANSTSDEVTVH